MCTATALFTVFHLTSSTFQGFPNFTHPVSLNYIPLRSLRPARAIARMAHSFDFDALIDEDFDGLGANVSEGSGSEGIETD